MAVYGRRRVGKTYLIRELFGDRMAFYHTGLSQMEQDDKSILSSQLHNFASSLRKYGCEVNSIGSWLQAFDLLSGLLASKIKPNPEIRQVVFIDELPWMDTPRSQFMSALEHFWNGWGAGVSQLMLIVCGSAASWMSDKLILNHGGLYGRLTAQMKLHPFSLAECEDFYRKNGIGLDRYSQLKLYMMIGGIPYYMSMVRRGMSLEENTRLLFTTDDARLKGELGLLFQSLFTNHEECLAIVRLLANKRIGFTRKEIASQLGVAYGGGLSKTLKVLEESDFIQSYTYYGMPQKEVRYRLVDFYSIYQLCVGEASDKSDAAMNGWFGFAFETLCWNHIDKIKLALGIADVRTEQFSWHANATDEYRGAQIDLVIKRADRASNICEIKFYNAEYFIDKTDDLDIRHKLSLYQRLNKCRDTIIPTLITTYGLSENKYSGLYQRVLTMDDLFMD